MSETIQPRPFEETIIDVIQAAHHPNALDSIIYLLKHTKILFNHDEIVSTWRQQLLILSLLADGNDFGVAEAMSAQKRGAQEMAKRDEAMLREQVRNEARWEAEDARIDCN